MSDEQILTNDLTLSAVDFLNLISEYMVARVDLADIGRRGVVYVRELTAAEKAAVLPRPKGKARMYKDQSMEIDWSQLSPNAAAKFLKTCLMAGEGLAPYFTANGPSTAMVPETALTPMYEQLVRQAGKPHLAMEKLEQLPNAIVDVLVKRIRDISGLDDDAEEDAEKKG